jgi:NAD(P)-dependent dehydrogenase (short-subunit alcohol dehydrogenase family)
MTLTGKVAWVIGGSSGIGAATAAELVARGARVAVSARRQEELEKVANGRMLVVPLDVRDAVAVRAAAAQVAEELGPIDIAVLAAGYWQQFDPTTWDTDAFDRHVQVNLIGMSNCIAAVLPVMLKRGAGTIAGVASVAGYRGLAGAEAYGATKAAQINMLESLRVHVGGSGVHVMTVCPGFVRTEMTATNDFPMPFMIEPAEAGRAICAGLGKGRAEIVFPLPMAVLMRSARYVPAGLWPRLTRGLGKK